MNFSVLLFTLILSTSAFATEWRRFQVNAPLQPSELVATTQISPLGLSFRGNLKTLFGFTVNAGYNPNHNTHVEEALNARKEIHALVNKAPSVQKYNALLHSQGSQWALDSEFSAFTTAGYVGINSDEDAEKIRRIFGSEKITLEFFDSLKTEYEFIVPQSCDYSTQARWVMRISSNGESIDFDYGAGARISDYVSIKGTEECARLKKEILASGALRSY